MTKQRNRPGVGVYFALILLLLCGYYLFFDMTRVPGVSYAQVEDLFRREQVQSFYVKDGSCTCPSGTGPPSATSWAARTGSGRIWGS